MSTGASVAQWCVDSSLTQTDVLLFTLVSALFLNGYALLCAAAIHQEKRLAWSISLLNSTLMSVVGVAYLWLAVGEHPQAFVFGSDGPTLFYGTNNLSVLICIWFGLANLADFLYGLVLYRSHLGILTTYVHHSMFIWMMYYAPTGNGLFVSSPPFAAAFCLMLVEEIPTLLLALGSMFPSCRTDIGFGTSFFLLRIVYHSYFTAYAAYSRMSGTVIVLYLLTLALHLSWFYSWATKYGKKLFGKRTKKTG